MRLAAALPALLTCAPPPHLARLAAPASARSAHIRAREIDPLSGPNDELKSRFDRSVEETRTSFSPPTREKAQVKSEPPPTQNEVLLAEIRALQPEKKKEPPPKRAPVDVSVCTACRGPAIASS